MGFVPFRGQWGTMVKRLILPNSVINKQPCNVNSGVVLYAMAAEPLTISSSFIDTGGQN